MLRALVAMLIALAIWSGSLAPAEAGKPRRGGNGRHGGNQVWSGLVMATNQPQPRPAQPEVNRLDGTLRRTFGYNQFEVIGQSRRALENDQSSWLAVSKHFSLHVDPRGVTRD